MKTIALTFGVLLGMLGAALAPAYAEQEIRSVGGSGGDEATACQIAGDRAQFLKPIASRLVGLGACSCSETSDGSWNCERTATYEKD